MKATFGAAIAALLVAGAVIAQERSAAGSVEARLDRIEQAIARIEQKLSARASGAMMEGCRDMMGGGMMGRGQRGSPNGQWRDAR